MKLTIPRDNPDEMLLYIWKIIDLPYISYDDLLYKIIFEFFIYLPKEAISFLNNALKSGLLIEDENSNFRLSDKLYRKFKIWQKGRQLEIEENMKSQKKRNNVIKEIEMNNGNKFNSFLKKLIDNGALNRAVSVSDDAINIITHDKNAGIIEAKIKGSKEKNYIVKISIKEKYIRHNCHDFETRRAKTKTFCKHLIKLFLLLKKEDENLAIYFLEKIINQINEWEFSS